jgi:hypothetical protein
VITLALKAASHLTAWLIWKSTRVSILDDLETPQRP